MFSIDKFRLILYNDNVDKGKPHLITRPLKFRAKGLLVTKKKPKRQEETTMIKLEAPSDLYKAFRQAQKTAYRKTFYEYDEAISPSEWATNAINGYHGPVSWDSVKAGFRDCISVRNHTGKKVVIKKPTRPLITPIDNFDDNDVEIIIIEECKEIFL